MIFKGDISEAAGQWWNKFGPGASNQILLMGLIKLCSDSGINNRIVNWKKCYKNTAHKSK